MSYNNGLLNGITSYVDDTQSAVAMALDYLRSAKDADNLEAAQIDIDSAVEKLEEV